jgi:hypothetical protein
LPCLPIAISATSSSPSQIGSLCIEVRGKFPRAFGPYCNELKRLKAGLGPGIGGGAELMGTRREP